MTTVYLPDDLAEEVRDKLGDENISAICQAALRAELARAEARAKVTAEGFERIEVYDARRGHDVAFQGRRIAVDPGSDLIAWLTPMDLIAVYGNEELWTFADYADFTGRDWPGTFAAEVAKEFGEKYTEELDI